MTPCSLQVLKAVLYFRNEYTRVLFPAQNAASSFLYVFNNPSQSLANHLDEVGPYTFDDMQIAQVTTFYNILQISEEVTLKLSEKKRGRGKRETKRTSGMSISLDWAPVQLLKFQLTHACITW